MRWFREAQAAKEKRLPFQQEALFWKREGKRKGVNLCSIPTAGRDEQQGKESACGFAQDDGNVKGTVLPVLDSE